MMFSMDRHLASLFIDSISSQARTALIADHHLRDLARHLDGPDAAVREHLWLWIHSFVNAAANVSKVLFPGRRRRELAEQFPLRGPILRDLLEVGEESPLRLQERALRNHLEHMDERLEAWWISDARHNFAQRSIGPIGGVVSDLDEASHFEQFDPVAFVLAFQGDTYQLIPVLDELTRIELKARDLQRVSYLRWDHEGLEGAHFGP